VDEIFVFTQEGAEKKGERRKEGSTGGGVKRGKRA